MERCFCLFSHAWLPKRISVDQRSSQCFPGGSLVNPHGIPRDWFYFSSEDRLGHRSEVISTVKVGEPGVSPGHLTTSFGLSLGKKSCCCPCFNCGLMPSPQILLASPVNLWFKVPSGNLRIFTLECKNPRNHHSLRKCVLIRFILVCECSCTLPLQYIFTTGFIKNDSARQMALFWRKEWFLWSYDLAVLNL